MSLKWIKIFQVKLIVLLHDVPKAIIYYAQFTLIYMNCYIAQLVISYFLSLKDIEAAKR